MLSKNIYSFKWWQMLNIYIFLYSAITYMVNSLIFTNAYYYSAYGNEFSIERIDEHIEMNNKFQWFGYAVIPVILLLKWIVIAGIIYTGFFLFNHNVSYKSCLKITIIAELALIGCALVKLISFLVHKPETMQEIQFFYPLSITQFFTPEEIPTYLVYPLQQLNLFEILYWVLITAGIQTHIQKSFLQSFKISVSSYGVALSIWVLFIVFIQLQFT